MKSQQPAFKLFFAAQSNFDIYFDSNKNRMAVLPMLVTQEMLDEQYKTVCSKILTEQDTKNVAFYSITNLHYMVILLKNEEEKEKKKKNTETTAALRRQLMLFHDLLRFRQRVVLNIAPMNMNLNMEETRRLMKPLCRSLRSMYNNNQFMLVQGIECVDLNPHNREMLVSNLQLSCANAPFVVHAVLLVGTKCAAIYSKPKTQQPPAPSSTQQASAQNSSFTLLPRDILCLIIYAHSVYQITEADESLFQSASASSQMTYSLKTETETSDEASDEETDDNKSEANKEEANNNDQSDDESQASGNIQEAPEEGHGEEEEEEDDAYEEEYENPIPTSKFDSVYLHTVPNRHIPSLTRCAIYSEHLPESNITVIYICQPDTVIEPATVSTPESPSERPPTNRELLVSAAQSLKQQRDFKTFTDFLKMKAFALTMQHYLHYCPGLIHFIFVDRIRDRVLAPRIVSLHTTRSFSESNGSVQSPTAESQQKIQLSVEFIKEKVWEMCHLLQEYQEKGFNEVALCAEGVQYWYKEWYEDEQGNEMRVMQPAHLKFVRGHYELYTMYLPFVSAQAVSTNNKWLVQNLLKSN